MKFLRPFAALPLILVSACDDRGDRAAPYAAKPGVFSRPDPGNVTGTPQGIAAGSDATGGATSGGVTSGAPSTLAEGSGSGGPDAEPHRSASGGENSSNSAGAGNSSSVPTAGGKGTPQEEREQEAEGQE